MTQTLSMTTERGPVEVSADRILGAAGSGYVLAGPDIRVQHPFGDTSFYRNGWNSWSPTGWRALSEEPLRIYDNPHRLLTADDAATDDPTRHQGSAVGALEVEPGTVLLLGALGLGAPQVGADQSTLWGRADVADLEWFIAVGNEQSVFDEYAGLVADRLGRSSAPAGPVWSSWYSFFEDVDEPRIHEVLDDLAGYPFDVVQIDDGWEQVVGDWHEGANFPSGLEALAARIRENGFRAGLWLAPFICLPQSTVAREHPEWLVQDPAGGPLTAGYNWDSHYFALDTTRSDVQEHLRSVFARFRDAGFTYFKLDFMYAGALAGVRSIDQHRDLVYRDAVQLVRDVVGPDTYLLGSGIPMLASTGVFDGARVGPDVAPYWDNTERKRDPSGPGALNSLANSVARIWMRSWFDVDPDVVFFRSRRSLLDERTNQVLIDLAQVAGTKSTSDLVAWLDPHEQEHLRQFLQTTEPVIQTGRYTFQVGSRTVDFGRYIAGGRREMESMLVK